MTDRPLSPTSGAGEIAASGTRLVESRGKSGSTGFQMAPSGVRIKQSATGPTRHQPARVPWPAYAVRPRDVVALHPRVTMPSTDRSTLAIAGRIGGARRRWRTTIEIAVIGGRGESGHGYTIA
jgi:hypothetical protein